MEFEKVKTTFGKIFNEVSKVIVGQDDVVEHILIAMLANQNALLESNPGLGKTTMIKTLADVLDLKFSRIQFTPDLMPSDVTGTQIVEEVNGKRYFKFQQGPLFANIVLADEINRATPKTQSALLEAMQEKQVTVGNKTYSLEEPFFVLATQNPIEQEGTYPLPEAQTDRFLLKIFVDFPDEDAELEIVERFTSKKIPDEPKKILPKHSVIKLQEYTREVPISNELKKKVVSIVQKTRDFDGIEYGASPRASIGLILASKARALIHGRANVNKEDIKKMAYPVLRHRIVLSFNAERKGLTPDAVISKILDKVF
jgi:MoxR-like ATPase